MIKKVVDFCKEPGCRYDHGKNVYRFLSVG